MIRFEFLIHRAVGLKRDLHPDSRLIARRIGDLYDEPGVGQMVCEALQDDFFPLSLFARYHLDKGTERAGQDLAIMSRMFFRIRRDIDRFFDNRTVTCVNLDGDALQHVPLDQWCSFCGECCQLSGTIPDPPDSIRYPGYWYSYIAGDGPLVQRFCPFLFELPPQDLFFCAIHNIKPLTCLAYEKQDCLKRHPGRARA